MWKVLNMLRFNIFVFIDIYNRLYNIEMYIHTFSLNNKITYEQSVNRLMKKWSPWSNQIKLCSY